MPILKIYPTNEHKPHFLTFTAIDRLQVFTEIKYHEVLLSNMEHCRKTMGLKIYAYVFMTDHIHVIWHSPENAKLSSIVQGYKSYTTSQIKNLIKNDPREYIKRLAQKTPGKKEESPFRLWQEYTSSEIIETEKIFQAKLSYMHNNPVQKGYVLYPYEWKYSSAANYITNDDSTFIIDRI